MNTREFLKEFKNISHKFNVLYGPQIRCQDLCPVTAVCLKLTGIRYSIGNFEDAAIALGMTADVAAGIVVAADEREPKNTQYLKTRETMLTYIHQADLLKEENSK